MTTFLILATMVAVNALYVAAEFSSVAVPRPWIAQAARDGNPRARGLLGVLEDPAQQDRCIAACQVGITLSSLLVGAYGQAALAPPLASALDRLLGRDPATTASLAAVLVLLALTGAQVILGELVPKNLALRFPAEVALLTYPATRLSVALYRPAIAFLNGSGLLLLRPFGLEAHGHQHVHGPEEIVLLLAESGRSGALSAETEQRLRRGLRLDKRTVHELMVPRGELEAIEVSTPTEQLFDRLRESPYSRLPVYRGTLDAVLGVVSSKELARRLMHQTPLPPLEDLVHPVPFVPESITADRLLRYLQEQRATIAIVVDEFGGVQGLISVEDVLAELLGDLADELKTPGPSPQRLEDGSVRLPGAMTLSDAEPWLGVRWSGGASTVGGHIVEVLGRLPRSGEVFPIGDLQVEILAAEPRAIRWILVRGATGETP